MADIADTFTPITRRSPEAQQAYHEGFMAGMRTASSIVNAAGQIQTAQSIDDIAAIHETTWKGMRDG